MRRFADLDEPTTRRAIAGLVVLGLLIRIFYASRYDPNVDLGNILETGALLPTEGFGVYGVVNPDGAPFPGYPYPPLFLPWAWFASEVDARFLARAPQMIADVAIVYLIDFVALRAAWSGAARIGAAALIMLSPIVIVISGVLGQLDGLAFAVALAGVLAWQYGGERRALYAGLLIGLGAAIKTPPLLLLFALIPTMRSWREIVVAGSVAVAVVVVPLIPFVIGDAEGVLRAVTYTGLPGQAGLAAVLQPELVEAPTGSGQVPLNGLTSTLDSINAPLILLAVLAVTALLRARRVAAVEAAAVLVLVVYVVGVNWFTQYAIWGLPFLIAAGYLRLALALSIPYAVYAWFLAGAVFSRLGLPDDATVGMKQVTAVVLWLAWAGSLAWLLRRIALRARQPDPLR